MASKLAIALRRQALEQQLEERLAEIEARLAVLEEAEGVIPSATPSTAATSRKPRKGD